MLRSFSTVLPSFGARTLSPQMARTLQLQVTGHRHHLVMLSLDQTIRERGGLAATHELLSAGFNKKSLSAAANHGLIVRVRQGWYCTTDVHPTVQQGIRVGGRVGCISGAALYGMWQPPDEHLHVSIKHEQCRLRTPHSMKRRLSVYPARVTTHWTTKNRTGSRLVLDPISCLAEVVRCQPVEYAVAVANSGMRTDSGRAPLLTLGEWERVAEGYPRRASTLRLADGVCESGTEVITWVRLARHHLPIRRQQWIDGKRVDFLVGRRLVVEIDGAAYHVDPVRFEADRSRDAELCAIGYIVLRFSYNQVIYRWPQVESAILAAVARGDHF